MELTTVEQSELESLETIINQNVGAFYKVGCALAKIRDSRLYRETHETFEEYCKDKWDMVSSRARQLCIAANTVDNLKSVTNGNTEPSNERQVRPLTRLETPELQQEVWQKVVETAPGGKITAWYVSKVVSEANNETTARKVNKQAYLAKKVNEKERIDKELQDAFDLFYYETQRAKMEKWKNTSKEAALYLVELTKDLIEIT